MRVIVSPSMPTWEYYHWGWRAFFASCGYPFDKILKKTGRRRYFLRTATTIMCNHENAQVLAAEVRKSKESAELGAAAGLYNKPVGYVSPLMSQL